MKNVCRLCLEIQANMLHIFAQNTLHLQLHSIIANYCSIKISEDDELPKWICIKCKRKLKNLHKFVQQCKNSDYKLQEYYKIANNVSILEKKKIYKDACVQTDRLKKSCRRKKSMKAQNDTDIDKFYSIQNISNNHDRPDHLNVTDLNHSEQAGVDFSTESVENEDKQKTQNESVRLKSHLRIYGKDQQKKQYLCDICSSTYASKTGLRLHIKSHSGLKPYACKFCNKSFTILSYKKRHEKTHTGDKHFVCHICSATYASSNGFKYHLKVHTGEANFHCGVCGKSFRRKKYLDEHTYTHTGEKPFKCKICGLTYRNSGSLYVHLKKCKL